MIVHRLLDALFRTLDTIDAARENIDRALGRDGDGKLMDAPAHDVTIADAAKPHPAVKRARAASPTSPPPRSTSHAAAKPAPAKKASSARVESKGPPRKGRDDDATASRKAAAKQKPGAAKASAVAKPKHAGAKKHAATATPALKNHEKHPSVDKAADKTNTRSVSKNLKKTVDKKLATQTAAETAGKHKPPSSSRKGSIDRSGKDFDSARARAVYVALKSKAGQVIQDDATLDGKKVLARVVWALFAAENAGSEMGLTAADASALLHLAGGMAVFSTNIARTCRDEVELIEESEPDGRIKRYKLTPRGREKAREIATQTIG